jgi:branched-chain polyamine synthase A-like protein
VAFESTARASHLAALVGEAATGRPVEGIPAPEIFAGWIDVLLQRHGCSEPVPVLGTPRKTLFASGASPREGGDGSLERFFLRLELKMAEATYRNVVSPRPSVDPELLDRFKTLVGGRSPALRKFFQGLIDPESSIRRATEIQRHLGPGLKSVLFVGDDDAASVALALVAPGYAIRVIDVDERVLQTVERASAVLGVALTSESLDLRGGVPFHLSRRFEGVVTDPPRNHSRCLAFLRFAEGCLSELEGSRLFWADHPDWTMNFAEVLARLPQLGLRCEAIVPELHFYPDPYEAFVDLNEWIESPVASDEDVSALLGILESIGRTFGLDPRWLRAVAFWSYPWSHLHVLARTAATT